jgi:hypothetical protein
VATAARSPQVPSLRIRDPGCVSAPVQLRVSAGGSSHLNQMDVTHAQSAGPLATTSPEETDEDDTYADTSQLPPRGLKRGRQHALSFCTAVASLYSTEPDHTGVHSPSLSRLEQFPRLEPECHQSLPK